MYQSVKFLAAALVFGGVISAASVKSQAAEESPCKRLTQEPCQAKGCSWVKSYKTTKGREVAAFCRKKPERKATTASAAPKS